MSFIKRYSEIIKGSLVLTGNTLGLSKLSNELQAGVEGSIGAFISLNNALQVPTFPFGTTLNYLENSSSAVLNLPEGSEVEYAELIWGGLYKSKVNSIENIIDNDIDFITPNGTFSLSPDPVTKGNFIIETGVNDIGFYVRSKEVTNLIINSTQETYSAAKVPALIEKSDSDTNATNHCGWSLAVVYKNNSELTKSIVLWVGGEPVIPFDSSVDITFNGFITPISGNVNGKLFLSTQEGDAVILNDKILFGENAGSLSLLSGPNNPENNFFCSQINGNNGLIDTSGTFGDRNSNAFTATNIIGGRQGWDVTSVSINNLLQNNQTEALIRLETEGDLYLPNMVGIQIESLQAQIELTKEVDKSIAEVGETINYTIKVKNMGDIIANEVLINDILPIGLELISGTIKVDGIAQPDTLPINLGSIDAGELKTITYAAKATEIPTINPAINIAIADYSFEPFEGTVINEESNSNEVEVFIYEKDVEIIKSVNKAYAQVGEEIEYTSVIKNNGTTKIENLFYIDEIPLGTQFVSGSVIIDGVPFVNYNPQTGFTLEDLEPNESTTVIFKVLLTQGDIMLILNTSEIDFDFILPDGTVVQSSEESNEVQTENLSFSFVKEKTTSQEVAKECDEIIQTVTLTNTSSTTIYNLFFKDEMTEGAEYIDGSVVVNGEAKPELDLETGFVLSNIEPNGKAIIQYKIIITNSSDYDSINNHANLNYTVLDPIQGEINLADSTNVVNIQLADIDISIVKTVSSLTACRGDVLTYISKITNNGTITATNLKFIDNIPSNSSFIQGSLLIDGNASNENPVVGFDIPDIESNDTVTILFKVRVL